MHCFFYFFNCPIICQYCHSVLRCGLVRLILQEIATLKLTRLLSLKGERKCMNKILNKLNKWSHFYVQIILHFSCSSERKIMYSYCFSAAHFKLEATMLQFVCPLKPKEKNKKTKESLKMSITWDDLINLLICSYISVFAGQNWIWAWACHTTFRCFEVLCFVKVLWFWLAPKI